MWYGQVRQSAFGPLAGWEHSAKGLATVGGSAACGGRERVHLNHFELYKCKARVKNGLGVTVFEGKCNGLVLFRSSVHVVYGVACSCCMHVRVDRSRSPRGDAGRLRCLRSECSGDVPRTRAI